MSSFKLQISSWASFFASFQLNRGRLYLWNFIICKWSSFQPFHEREKQELRGTWSASGPHSCRYPGMLQVCTNTKYHPIPYTLHDPTWYHFWWSVSLHSISHNQVKAHPKATALQAHSSCRGSWTSSTTSPTAHRFFFGPLLFGSFGRSKIRQNSPEISGKEGEELRYRWMSEHENRVQDPLLSIGRILLQLLIGRQPCCFAPAVKKGR